MLKINPRYVVIQLEKVYSKSLNVINTGKYRAELKRQYIVSQRA
jgi:hypothetical protein